MTDYNTNDLGELLLDEFGLSAEVLAEYETIIKKSIKNEELTQREINMLFFYLRHQDNKNFKVLNKTIRRPRKASKTKNKRKYKRKKPIADK